MRVFVILGILVSFLFYNVEAKAEFGGHAGVHFNYGKLGTDANGPYLFDSRAVGTFDGEFMPGWRILDGSMLVGLLFDLRFLAQLSNASTDFSGHGYSLGPGISYEILLLKLLFSYDLWLRHTFTGPNTTFKGKGYHFLLGYKIFPATSVDLEYVTGSFDSMNQTGQDFPLSPQAVKFWTIGFGLSFSF